MPSNTTARNAYASLGFSDLDSEGDDAFVAQPLNIHVDAPDEQRLVPTYNQEDASFHTPIPAPAQQDATWPSVQRVRKSPKSIAQHLLAVRRGWRPARSPVPDMKSESEDFDYEVEDEHATSTESGSHLLEEFQAEEYEDSVQGEMYRLVFPTDHPASPAEVVSHHAVDHLDHNIALEHPEDNPPIPGTLREPVSDLTAILYNDFKPTPYPDEECMFLLSIQEDVERMFDSCGLTQFMSMPGHTYKNETAQFLATLKFVPKKEEGSTYGGGLIAFKVNGRRYKRSLKDIQELFGFPRGYATPSIFDNAELQGVWRMISNQESFASARAKGHRIRNPAINYARRGMAEVFYSRDKTGTVNAGEIKLLTSALKKIAKRLPNNQKIVGDTARSSLAYTFIMHLQTYKQRAMTQYVRRVKKPITVGGPVGAILRLCGVPLDEASSLPHKFMDFEYLRTQRMLDSKEFNEQPVFRFGIYPHDEYRIVMPIPELTSLDRYENIMFHPPSNLFVSQNQLKRRPRKRVPRSTQPPCVREDANVSPPRRASPVPRHDSDESEGMEPKFNLNDPAYQEQRLTGLTTNIKACQSRVNVIVQPVKWMAKRWKNIVKIQSEWNSEKEVMRREKEELRQVKEAMRQSMETERQQREAARLAFENERASFRDMMQSINERFTAAAADTVRPVNPGRHSVSTAATWDAVPDAEPQPGRHSTAGDGSLVRRPRRRNAPLPDTTTPVIDLTPQEPPESSAPPVRRRRVRMPRHVPDSSPQDAITDNVAPSVPTYTRESIDAELHRYFSQD